MGDALRLLHLSLRMIAGRRFWLWPLVTLLWPAFQVFQLVARWRPNDYAPSDAQVVLIGFPMTVLAMGLGMRVIAGELDRRTLEIAYTVPGGTHRVWLSKLLAALVLLVAAEALLAVATFLFCTSFPPGALYGALQAALFYLVLTMGLAALCKSEAAGALLAVVVLGVNLFAQSTRLSPSFNPESLATTADAADLVAWTVQNRIGFALVTVALAALAFGRAEHRERMLSG
jgi:ABC-type transport system involved in multi-copper enzyme maturation permease subunit